MLFWTKTLPVPRMGPLRIFNHRTPMHSSILVYQCVTMYALKFQILIWKQDYKGQFIVNANADATQTQRRRNADATQTQRRRNADSTRAEQSRERIGHTREQWDADETQQKVKFF